MRWLPPEMDNYFFSLHMIVRALVWADNSEAQKILTAIQNENNQ